MSIMRELEGDLMVSVYMLTYNHEKFIVQAIESVLMQETNFRFNLIIGEDCSTDNTREICLKYKEKYPEIIELFLPEKNVGAIRNNIELLERCKGKYVAICEGDDYWTDPLKLQKQVDLMEANAEYVLSCHRYEVLDEEMKTWQPDYGEFLFSDGVDGVVVDKYTNFKVAWLTKSMTMLFRRDALDISLLRRYRYLRDLHIFYHLLKIGDGYCMNYDAAVYRLHERGVHSKTSQNAQDMANYRIYDELLYYNRDDKLVEELLEKYKRKTFYYLWNNFYQKKYTDNIFHDSMFFLKKEYKRSGLKQASSYLLKISASIIKGILSFR